MLAVLSDHLDAPGGLCSWRLLAARQHLAGFQFLLRRRTKTGGILEFRHASLLFLTLFARPRIRGTRVVLNGDPAATIHILRLLDHTGSRRPDLTSSRKHHSSAVGVIDADQGIGFQRLPLFTLRLMGALVKLLRILSLLLLGLLLPARLLLRLLALPLTRLLLLLGLWLLLFLLSGGVRRKSGVW